MSGFLDNFELADGTGWKAAAQAAPAALAGFQAIKAQRDYGNKVTEIESLLENRQQLSNPYANISNPFANLQVATKAAEMQADQTDIALANTLDTLRQTGAGGATALAQAALKSKQGIAADIQRQETQNQRLQAQGQQRVDLAKAQGQMQTMMLQEKRTEADLTRLQDQADLLKAQQIYSTQSAMSSLGKGLETLAGGIVPKQLPTITEGADGPPPEKDFFTNLSDPNNPFSFMQQDIDNFQSINPQSSQGIVSSGPKVPGATTLTQYYQGLGQGLPSLQDRRGLYTQAGLGSSYSGTYDQNAALLEFLQNK